MSRLFPEESRFGFIDQEIKDTITRCAKWRDDDNFYCCTAIQVATEAAVELNKKYTIFFTLEEGNVLINFAQGEIDRIYNKQDEQEYTIEDQYNDYYNNIFTT